MMKFQFLREVSMILFSIFLYKAASAQTFEVDTLSLRGSIDKYINFVYMGDGYTESEQDLFITHITGINASFFERSPYSNYRNFFNIFVIKVISPQSGVKHPLTAADCPEMTSFPYANPTNYFGTSFDLWDVHRLIYPTDYDGIENVLADNFPAYDQVLFIGNTEQYGGAGGAYAVGTAHPLSVEIMLHEAGHSFAGLADEYWAGIAYGAERPNMTNVAYATSSLVKWQDWLGVSGVGIYAHCCGEGASDWYKPHTSCLMEYLENEFCVVCRQRTIEKIYEIVNPIVQYVPESSSLSISEPAVFKLTEMMRPIPNTLKISWKLNDITVASNIDTLLLLPEMLEPGMNILKAEVTDTSFMLRVIPTFTHHINNVTWTINNGTSGIAVESQNNDIAITVFPNPASDFIKVKGSGLTAASGTVIIEIIDIKGSALLHTTTESYDQVFEKSIDVSAIPPGNYFLSVSADGKHEKFKISIVH